MRHILIPLALASTAVAANADAAVTVRDIAVENGSFEAYAIGDGEFSYNRPAGWTTRGTDGSVGTQNPTAAAVAKVPDGQNVAFLNSYLWIDGRRFGSMEQTLGEAIGAGTVYSLSVDVVRRTDVAQFGRWIVELLAGDDVVGINTLSANEVASGGFATLKLDYTGTADTAGRALGIRFQTFYDPDQGSEFRQVNIDNVRVTATGETVVAPVPEPATWAMMICGFAMVGAAARRRRSSSRIVTA